MDLDLGIPKEQVAHSIAKKYHREKEFGDRLKELGSGYRRNAKDLTELMHEVCTEDDANKGVQKTLEEKTAAVAEKRYSLANKVSTSIISEWYYPFVGALPYKYQKSIAKKFGDNPLGYTVANTIVEWLGGTAIIFSYSFGWLNEEYHNFAIGCFIYATVLSIIRAELVHFKAVTGSPLFALPCRVAMYGSKVFAAAKKESNSYAKTQKKLQKRNKTEQKKQLRQRIENSLSGQEQPLLAETVEEELSGIPKRIK